MFPDHIAGPIDSSENADTTERSARPELGPEQGVGTVDQPNGRPVIERFFRTIDRELLPFFK
ncbi:hypothetical protein [uncultured Aureimonas sp.]|uniref:hypothetical protein n=1 Tax=uncultured Aureimonas sp. TaxID=1604662 RepID=UPI0025F855A9|nr:hypothetical protein [uncultured Aureimonas sp.]